jgi:retinol-binding protein 3
VNTLVRLAAIAVLTFSLPAISFTRSLVSQNSAAGQGSEPSRIDAGQRRQAVTELARILRARYCTAPTAEKAATFVERKLAEGGYDKLAGAEAFAQALTADLQNVTQDKHIRFGVVAPPPPAPGASSATGGNEEAERAARILEARRSNYGLVKAEVLSGNVGYLEVRRFQSPDLAGDTIAASMQFLVNSDAIIVDLRNCHGGSPFAMPIFAGYFLSRPTHLFDMEFRGDNYTDHFWTTAWLPGKRLAGIPMYILTSAYTFSGAEGFAYRFKVLKRATIVGETTGGGANAGGVLDVAPFFRVWMPMGRPVDRDTATNWEGTGVLPDIKTAAREALAIAHVEALKTFRSKSANDQERARVDWAVARAQARYDPPDVTARDLERLAGSYEKSRAWVEGGQLRFQRENESPYLLVPIARGVFVSETNDPIRIEFVLQSDGKVEKVLFADEDGTLHELAKIG